MLKRMSDTFHIQIGDSFEEEIVKESERLREGRFSGPFLLLTSLYYQNITKFAELFGRKNILILYTSQLKDKPEEVYKEICNFLNVDFNLLDKSLFLTKKNTIMKKDLGISIKYYTCQPLRK